MLYSCKKLEEAISPIAARPASCMRLLMGTARTPGLENHMSPPLTRYFLPAEVSGSKISARALVPCV